MIKKTAVMLVVFLSLFSACVYCDDQGGVKITQSGWILLTADAALSAAAVWTLIDRNTQAGAYNSLREQINGTTEANYWRLKYEKSKVDARDFNVALTFSFAGAALAYTALDFFWLHNVFPVEIQPVIDPLNKENGIKIKEVF